MLPYGLVFHSFLLLNSIPLYGYVTYCLSIDLLMDIWIVSTFSLLQIMLFEYWCGSCCMDILSFLLVRYTEMDLLGLMTNLQLTF